MKEFIVHCDAFIRAAGKPHFYRHYSKHLFAYDEIDAEWAMMDEIEAQLDFHTICTLKVQQVQ